MASKAAASAVKAIYAAPAFVPKGPINSGRFNLIREIVIGSGLGLTAGLIWKVRGSARTLSSAGLRPQRQQSLAGAGGEQQQQQPHWAVQARPVQARVVLAAGEAAMAQRLHSAASLTRAPAAAATTLPCLAVMALEREAPHRAVLL